MLRAICLILAFAAGAILPSCGGTNKDPVQPDKDDTAQEIFIGQTIRFSENAVPFPALVAEFPFGATRTYQLNITDDQRVGLTQNLTDVRCPNETLADGPFITLKKGNGETVTTDFVRFAATAVESDNYLADLPMGRYAVHVSFYAMASNCRGILDFILTDESGDDTDLDNPVDAGGNDNTDSEVDADGGETEATPGDLDSDEADDDATDEGATDAGSADGDDTSDSDIEVPNDQLPADLRFVGDWVHIDNSNESELIHTLSIADDMTAQETISVNAELILDRDITITFWATHIDERLRYQIERVRTSDASHPEPVGATKYCIFHFNEDPSIKEFTMGCNQEDAGYPINYWDGITFREPVIVPPTPPPPAGDVIVELTQLDLPIPDRTPAGISQVISVSDDVEITDVWVSIDIEHSYIGDLIVSISSPDGIAVDLHRRSGGSQSDLYETYGTGETQPYGQLSDFWGLRTQGDWVLFVSDNASSDEGVLKSVSLRFSQ